MASDTSYLPLLGFGAGLLNASQPGQARGFGGALSAGLLGGLQGMQLAQQQEESDRTSRLRELQTTLMLRQMQKAEAEAQKRQAAFAQATAGMDPTQAALLEAGGPEAMSAYIQRQFEPPKPPTTRTIAIGGEDVTQEFDPTTGGWREIGRGARWAPQQPREDNLVAVIGPNGPTLVPESKAAGMTPYNDRYESPSPIAKLIAERDALPPGDPRRATYDAAIAKDTTRGNGLAITGYDDAGRPLISMGGTVDPVTQRDATKEVRKSDLAFKTADDALAKLDERIAQTGMAVLPGADQQETSTIYRLTINELRKLTESGALQKADLDYLQSIIQDPTSFGAAAQAAGNLIGTGSPVTGTRAQIKQARDYLANVRQRTGQVYNPTAGAAQSQAASEPAPAPAAQPTSGPPPPQISSDAEYDALPSGAYYMAPDGKMRQKR